jgi:hypothetical protein
MRYIIIITIIISSTCYGQKKVYYYQSTGFDTLTVNENNKFMHVGGVGLAQSIIYEGEIIQRNDTLLLIQKTPTIVNKVNTIELDSYNMNKVDTLLIIDNKTLIDVTNNNESYYKLIQEYKKDSLSRVYNWIYKDTVINHRHINDYPIELKNKN